MNVCNRLVRQTIIYNINYMLTFQTASKANVSNARFTGGPPLVHFSASMVVVTIVSYFMSNDRKALCCPIAQPRQQMLGKSDLYN